MRCAAIDIGTVTCRLLVADIDDSGLVQVAKCYRICNLGEGVDSTGLLSDDAMQRVCAAIAYFKDVMASLEPDDGSGIKLTCMATSASRDARNADVFRSMLLDMGVTLRVIPGTVEAGLSFKGASGAYAGERVVVVDPGGGSTEVVAGIAGELPERSHSFNVGCRRITERFFAGESPSAGEIQAARQWVRDEMSWYFDELRACSQLPARIIAVAGTATSVVSVHEGMETYDPSRVQGAFVSREILDEVYDSLSGMTFDERQHVVGLDPERASVISGGLLILQEVVSLAGAQGYTASETDILEGMVIDMYESEAPAAIS